MSRNLRLLAARRKMSDNWSQASTIPPTFDATTQVNGDIFTREPIVDTRRLPTLQSLQRSQLQDNLPLQLYQQPYALPSGISLNRIPTSTFPQAQQSTSETVQIGQSRPPPLSRNKVTSSTGTTAKKRAITSSRAGRKKQPRQPPRLPVTSSDCIRNPCSLTDPITSPQTGDIVNTELVTAIKDVFSSKFDEIAMKFATSQERLINTVEQIHNHNRENSSSIISEMRALSNKVDSLTDVMKNFCEYMGSRPINSDDNVVRTKTCSEYLKYLTYLEFDPSKNGSRIFWNPSAESKVIEESAAFVLDTSNQKSIKDFLKDRARKIVIHKILKRAQSRAHQQLRDAAVAAWFGHLTGSSRNILGRFRSQRRSKGSVSKTEAVITDLERKTAKELLRIENYRRPNYDVAWKMAVYSVVTKAHSQGTDQYKNLLAKDQVRAQQLPKLWEKVQYDPEGKASVSVGVAAFVVTKIEATLRAIAGNNSALKTSHCKPWSQHAIRLHKSFDAWPHSQLDRPYEFVEDVVVSSAFDDESYSNVFGMGMRKLVAKETEEESYSEYE